MKLQTSVRLLISANSMFFMSIKDRLSVILLSREVKSPLYQYPLILRGIGFSKFWGDGFVEKDMIVSSFFYYFVRIYS